MAAPGVRAPLPRRRSRVLFLLAAGAGVLFAAAIVGDRQRAWEERQRLAALAQVGNGYAQEVAGLAREGSAAQKLKALRKMMAQTSLELQGSDRAESRAIRREEKLVALPNIGVEQGASAEWASGGSAQRRDLRRTIGGEQSLGTLAGGSSGDTAAPARTASTLQERQASAGALAEIHRQQELYALAARAPAASPEVPLAQSFPAQGAGDVAAAMQAGYAAAPRAQQLAQVWRGTGAVYAPSVMTPYQQQMLQSYMGSPTIPSPPATRMFSGPVQSLESKGAVRAPSSQLHGPALAEAWKAYLDPESVHHKKAEIKQVGAQTEAPAKASKLSERAGLGQAVVKVAEDSDGVLQRAETIMSSVKKLLARPHNHPAAAASNGPNGDFPKTLTAQEAGAIAKEASEGAVAAVLNKDHPHEEHLREQLAAAKAEHKKLENERASIRAGKSSAMTSRDAARTQVLAVVRTSLNKLDSNVSSHARAANATVPDANATVLATHGTTRPVVGHSRKDDKQGNQSSAGARTPIEPPTRLPTLPALPSSPAVEQETATPAVPEQAQAVPEQVQVLPTVESPPTSGDKGHESKRVAATDASAAGMQGPMVDVDIRDSKIMGGLHISRNTGERTGAGAQSGCGALCELGKMMQRMQGDSYQSLRGSHIPPALAKSGRRMVERDYVISHIGGKPVYAHEMVPASETDSDRSVKSDGAGAGSAGDVDGLEGSLERAIEREGVREGERRERRRERERHGLEWEHYRHRGRRAIDDGEREGRGAEDMRMVLSRRDMDGMTSGARNDKDAATHIHLRMPGPVKYRAVREEIPVAEYEAMTGGGAVPPGSDLTARTAEQSAASELRALPVGGSQGPEGVSSRMASALTGRAAQLPAADPAWQQQLVQVGDSDVGYADVNRDLDGIY